MEPASIAAAPMKGSATRIGLPDRSFGSQFRISRAAVFNDEYFFQSLNIGQKCWPAYLHSLIAV